MMRTLVRGVEIVFPNEVKRGNVVWDEHQILDIDASPTTAADEVIDGTGLHLMPGVIDDQVHFREPGLTHKEDLASASRACAAGGVTTYLEMPNTIPNAVTIERVRDKERIASQVSLVNFGFYIGATLDNVKELGQATEIPGIKIFIGSSTGDLLVDEQAALERIFAETTLPICAHCEDETTVRGNAARFAGTTNIADHSRIRDVNAAVIATRRAIELAQRHRHRFHVLHVSTADEIPLLAVAGEMITAEVCPHHLFFNENDYARLGSRIQMNPSVKSSRDNDALFNALQEGYIQVMATDHAPHTLEEKSKPYPASPSGLPAVENFLPLMLDQVNRGRFTLSQLASWMSDAPARVWGMVGKGRIEPGYDADLVLVDLHATRVVRDEEQYTKCRWSPWHGESLRGWPVMTWVQGRKVFARGSFDDSVRGSKPRFDHSRGGYWNTVDGIGPHDA